MGAAVLAGMLAYGGVAEARVEKGACMVTVLKHGGKNLALMKCTVPSMRGNGAIRMERWEKDGAKEYRALARFAGRRFSCDLKFEGLRRDKGYQFSRYYIEKCR
ncbi:hypothetical protein [Rhizobium sp.]